MTNTTYNQMLACSVIVGGGSGVLIQPMSDTYSYVLTAKHVITDQIKTNSSDTNKVEVEVEVEDVNGAGIAISDYLINPEHDIAILKTSQVIPSALMRCIDNVKPDEKLYIFGYPKTRRDEKNNEAKPRSFEGKTTVRVLNNIFSIALETLPDHTQLLGISGGGVFREIAGTIYLCGVEFKVEGDPNKEHHGQAECVPLGKFDELIAQNSENYAPILPPYLLNFSYVKEHTFGFNGVGTPESVDFLKSLLHNNIQSHIAQQTLPRPLDLYHKYKDTLLIHQSPSEDAFNIKLWIALLEFLIITSLIDEQQPIDICTLEKHASKRKFLFSATETNWSMLLQKIFLSDLRGLAANGAVIIDAGRCDGTYTPSQLTIKKVISDIGRRDHTNMKIDAPIKNPAKAFNFYHWQGLHRECVIEKEDEYADFNAFADGDDKTAVLTKIKDDYAQFLG